jgi:hypothetical protein
MKISNHAPYAEERFETARQHPILHPERIIGNSELSRNGFEEVGRISTGKSSRHLVKKSSTDEMGVREELADWCFRPYHGIGPPRGAAAPFYGKVNYDKIKTFVRSFAASRF